jgi:hypothetical protein
MAWTVGRPGSTFAIAIAAQVGERDDFPAHRTVRA